MFTTTRRILAVGAVTVGLVGLAQGPASAAGPQPLPDAACSHGTMTAAQNAPNRTAAEAIPHVEHAFPVPVPYCHHFNPTATPPTGP
jgi:hypothetical protein